MIHIDTIEEVKGRLDIIEVIGEFVPLKKAGQNYKGKSPFTNEKTPSFFVVPSKKIFKDFSSGKGGDALTFLMEHEGMSYPETILYLAEKYGIEVKEEQAGRHEEGNQHLKSALYACMDFAKRYYQQQLLSTDDDAVPLGLHYLHTRGFDDEAIRVFELGHAPDYWEHFSREALREGYSEEVLEQAGLLVKKNDQKFYDLFRGRIIFPIHDLLGRAIAFGARTLDKEGSQPKYLNSPETPIYYKSQALYGLFQAKNTIRKEDNCYLVEGYTDVISMHQIGVKNTVSPLGTAFTEQQVRLIKRFTNRVTLLFDGDSAGIRATLRSVELILGEGLDAYVLLPPEGHDPASYLARVGKERFKAFLAENKKDFVKFQADLYAQEIVEDTARKAEILGELVKVIALVPDIIKRSLYVKQAGDLFAVSEAVMIAALNKKIVATQQTLEKKRERSLEPPTAKTPKPTDDPLDEQAMIQCQERETIRLLLNYADAECDAGKLSDFMRHELDDVVFTHPTYREIYHAFKASWEKKKPIDTQYFFREGSESIQREVSELLVSRHTVSPNWKKKYHIAFPEENEVLHELAQSNVLRLKLRIVQNMAQQNRIKIKAAEEQGLDQETEDLLDHQMHLDQVKQQLAKLLGIVVI